jgi:porphobilinogen synthase
MPCVKIKKGKTMPYPIQRPRRLRQTASIRHFVQDIQLPYEKLVLPLFIRFGRGDIKPISSMPGHAQIHLQHIPDLISHLTQLGLKSVILFGIPEQKDPKGSFSYDDNGVIQQAIRLIKQTNPNMIVMADTCLCEYTDHGHCGILHSHGDDIHIDNDTSIDLLGKQALSYAKAGADIIAPSACMDGMIRAIRATLDQHHFQNTIVLSYAVKYASHLYGPFRQAAEGAPQIGNRQSYQMDYQNTKDALLECALDVEEGADMLMVKPGHTYLDVIYRVKQQYPHIPLGAYHTSGEFAMIKAAASQGLIDEQKVVHEILCALHRAGSDFILTYYAKEALEWRLNN